MKTNDKQPRKLKQLPHKPSRLIRIAIRDIQRARKDPRLGIDMSSWHEPVDNGRKGVCYVCFSGAVMHFGLVPPGDCSGRLESENLHPEKYSKHNETALYALNDFRIGLPRDGCKVLGVKTELESRFICDPEVDFDGFIVDMKQLAKEFAKEGN